MRKNIQDYDVPALSALTQELIALLGKALTQAALSRKQAEEVIKGLPFPRYREQHLPESHAPLEPRILEHLYVDQGKARKIEELLAIAVDVLTAAEAEARLNADQLQKLAVRLQSGALPISINDEFERAVANLANLHRWGGRADFSLHYATYRNKSEKDFADRSAGGYGKSNGKLRYREVLIEKLFELCEVAKEGSVKDLIDNHQPALEQLNENFVVNSGFSYAPPKVLNLWKSMCGWAKNDGKLRADLQRLEEVLEKTSRKPTKRLR